jgi:hypothetical protein
MEPRFCRLRRRTSRALYALNHCAIHSIIDGDDVRAILGQASGAYVGPTCWAVLFLAGATAILNQQSAAAFRRSTVPAGLYRTTVSIVPAWRAILEANSPLRTRSKLTNLPGRNPRTSIDPDQ